MHLHQSRSSRKRSHLLEKESFDPGILAMPTFEVSVRPHHMLWTNTSFDFFGLDTSSEIFLVQQGMPPLHTLIGDSRCVTSL